MNSRASAAMMFAFIFVIILGLLSLVTPRVTHYYCNGTTSKTYSLLGMTEMGGTTCEGGVTSKSTGFPFASKVNTTNLTSTGLVRADETNGYVLQTPGIIGNVMVYWIFGFLFFLVFAPLKRNRKYQSNPTGSHNGRARRSYN